MSIFILKPDAIGDFILATGCIRQLARERGEDRLIIAVRSDVAPLAASEFPQAEIVALPLRQKRRIVNVATVNIINCLPAWFRMLSLRVDEAICLRSMRNYLHTFFFCTPRAKRRIACENLLLANPRVRRPAVEKWVQRLFRPILLPYPTSNENLPTDIEANRIVASEALGRPITAEEAMPCLKKSTNQTHFGEDFWLLCPFSSTSSKDYPASSWAEALHGILKHQKGATLRLAAGPSQQEDLRVFEDQLRACGLDSVEILPPSSLPNFVDTVTQAKLVLTVDTAAAHMACALGIPAVIVSAGQHPGVYAPYSPNGKQVWLMPDLGLPKGQWRKNITPQKITDSALTLLSS